MLDLPGTLCYKASFEIKPRDTTCSSDDLYENVIDFVFRHMQRHVSCGMEQEQFRSHGVFSCIDNTIRGEIASLQDDEGDMWAIKLRQKDPEHNRRTWTIHIGARLRKADLTVTMYYLESYSDYLAGSLAIPPKPCPHAPIFILELLSAFDCYVGENAIPTLPAYINLSSYDLFLDTVQDTQRGLPVILVAVPSLVNPNLLCELTLGNALIYYVDESFPLEVLDVRLPRGMFIPPRSASIFFPYREDVLRYKSIVQDDIVRYGGQATAESIRRAFCEGLRNREKRIFFTYDDLMYRLTQQKLTHAETLACSLREEKRRLASAQTEVQKENGRLAAEVERLKALLDHDLLKELSQYEEALSDGMARMDAIKKQLMEITTGLFEVRDNIPLIKGLPVCAELAHLLEAVKFRLHLKQSKSP